MHELVPADRKADVRRTRGNGREEDQVTRFDLVPIDGRAGAKLIDGQAWNLDSVLGEDVVYEAATVEPRWGGAPLRYGVPRSASAVPVTPEPIGARRAGSGGRPRVVQAPSVRPIRMTRIARVCMICLSVTVADRGRTPTLFIW